MRTPALFFGVVLIIPDLVPFYINWRMRLLVRIEQLASVLTEMLLNPEANLVRINIFIIISSNL